MISSVEKHWLWKRLSTDDLGNMKPVVVFYRCNWWRSWLKSWARGSCEGDSRSWGGFIEKLNVGAETVVTSSSHGVVGIGR
ncbi:hypothetical protein L2E82_10153 [Cichorium intybus]|uniref:Uncharacterized protein n=1 Tax=Cichorium intybus TaxID=13427 RepID=A0ACB9G9V4_CICIN|nr:hypothetical protein L2E82_10153 [Cichorium intybus]